MTMCGSAAKRLTYVVNKILNTVLDSSFRSKLLAVSPLARFFTAHSPNSLLARPPSLAKLTPVCSTNADTRARKDKESKLISFEVTMQPPCRLETSTDHSNDSNVIVLTMNPALHTPPLTACSRHTCSLTYFDKPPSLDCSLA